MESRKSIEIRWLFKILLGIAFLIVALSISSPEVYAAGTVKKVTVTNVSSKKLTVNKGKTFKLETKVTVTGGASKALTYTSSNEKIVTVSKGVVKGVKAGKASITIASKQNKKVKVVIKVTVVTPVTKVKLSDATVDAGKSVQLKFTVTPTSATNKKLTWSSSNTKIAKVNASTGEVKGVASGTATITATAKDGSGVKGSCTVTVEETYKVSGTVKDANNNAMSGVTVKISNQSVTTDKNGKYSITVKKGTYSIVATCKTSDGDTADSTLKNQSVTKKLTKDIKMPAYYVTVSLKNRNDYGKWYSGKTSFGSSNKLLLKTETAYTLTTTRDDEVYQATVTIAKNKTPTTVTPVIEPVRLKGNLTLGKESTISVTDDEDYYKIVIPTKGKYYIYTTKELDTYTLCTKGSDDMDELDDYEDISECSACAQAYYYESLEKGTYYLKVSSDPSQKDVKVAVTKERPVVTTKTISAESSKTEKLASDSTTYYQFTPSKAGNYYFYLDGSEDVGLSLRTIDASTDQFTEEDPVVINVDSYHTQTYCSEKLQANKAYYLEITSEVQVTVTIGITAIQPGLSDKQIVEEEDEITVAETWYKFVPQKSGKYYFYVDGDLTEDDDVNATLQTANPEYDVNDAINAETEDTEDDEDSETIVEAYQELDLTDIESRYDRCYASTELEAGTIYYISVESEKEIRLGVTATHPTITDYLLTVESNPQSATLAVDETVYYEFVPEKTGTYYFYATANLGFDLYDESNEILNADSIPSKYKNCIYYECEANTVYYLVLSNIDEESISVEFGVTATQPIDEIVVGTLETATCTEDTELCYKFVPTESGQYYFYVKDEDVTLALYEDKYKNDIDVSCELLPSGGQYLVYQFEAGKEYYLGISSDEMKDVQFGVTKELNKVK